MATDLAKLPSVLMSENIPLSSVSLDPQPEPCPTPLAWQEVLREFDQQSLIRTYETELGELDLTEFGQGPPLLFLPGIVGTPRLFALTAWLLRDEFRCLLPDHPRWKRRPRTKDLIGQTAEVVAAVGRHLAGEGLDLFGTSFGGQVALELMLRQPGLVRRAVLQSSWAWRRLTVTEKAVLQIGRGVWLPIQKVPLWLSTQVQNHRRWFPPFDETRFGFLLNQTYATPTREVSRRLLAAGQTDLRPMLGSIEHPVLILKCEGDGRQISAAEEELERDLPSARTVEMHTTGLFPYLTHPHRLVKILREQFADAK